MQLHVCLLLLVFTTDESWSLCGGDISLDRPVGHLSLIIPGIHPDNQSLMTDPARLQTTCVWILDLPAGRAVRLTLERGVTMTAGCPDEPVLDHSDTILLSGCDKAHLTWTGLAHSSDVVQLWYSVQDTQTHSGPPPSTHILQESWVTAVEGNIASEEVRVRLYEGSGPTTPDPGPRAASSSTTPGRTTLPEEALNNGPETSGPVGPPDCPASALPDCLHTVDSHTQSVDTHTDGLKTDWLPLTTSRDVTVSPELRSRPRITERVFAFTVDPITLLSENRTPPGSSGPPTSSSIQTFTGTPADTLVGTVPSFIRLGQSGSPGPADPRPTSLSQFESLAQRTGTASHQTHTQTSTQHTDVSVSTQYSETPGESTTPVLTLMEDTRTNTEDTRTHTEDSRSHTEDTQTHTEDTRTHTEDTRTHTEDTQTHAVDSRSHTEDTVTHTKDTQTHTVDIQTHTEDTGTYTKDIQTHIVDTRTPMEDTRTHTEDTRTHTEDTQTHAVDTGTHTKDTQTHTVDIQTHTEDTGTYTKDIRTHIVDTRTPMEDTRTHTEDTRTHTEDTQTHAVDSRSHTEDTGTHTKDTQTHTVDIQTHTEDTGTYTKDIRTHIVDTRTPIEDTRTHTADTGIHRVDTRTHTADTGIHTVDTRTHTEGTQTHIPVTPSSSLVSLSSQSPTVFITTPERGSDPERLIPSVSTTNVPVTSQNSPKHPTSTTQTREQQKSSTIVTGPHLSQAVHTPPAATTPPKFFIVPDQPATIRVETVELLLQMVVEDSRAASPAGLQEDTSVWVAPYLRRVAGFGRVLDVWSNGQAVQSLLEFHTGGALQWIGTAGSLLERTGLARVVRDGTRFRKSRITNITVGGVQSDVCDWLLQCPAGFNCVSESGNFSCSSVCHTDHCHHHGLCTHHTHHLPVCRCLVGEDFWFMGRRCDVRMTRARLVGTCLAIVLLLVSIIGVLALVAVRRYRAALIQAKVDQTRSSYRRFNHFDELSGRFWVRPAAGSADSLDNPAFTRSDELLHLRALDRPCCYHDDTLSLPSTCPSHINTVYPHSSQYGWRGSEVSVGEGILDSGKASDLSVCSWPVEPIHWTPFPLLQQLAVQRTPMVRVSRPRSYCEGMELVDLGKSWTA